MNFYLPKSTLYVNLLLKLEIAYRIFIRLKFNVKLIYGSRSFC